MDVTLTGSKHLRLMERYDYKQSEQDSDLRRENKPQPRW